MPSDESISASREMRQARQTLKQIEQSMLDAGVTRLLDDSQMLSSEELSQIFDGIDSGSAVGRETMKAACELAAFDPELAPVRDAEMRAEVATDGMSVDVTIIPALGEGRSMDVNVLLAELQSQHHVTHGIQREVVDKLIEAGKTAPVHAVVACGVPPVLGKSENWELTSANEPDTPSKEERVDFREMAARNAVASGDLLASCQAAEPGETGINVRGEIVLPAESPSGRMLGVGAGTERRNNEIFATRPGEMHLENETISILQVRHIAGDVDFSSGNIDFPGTVMIKGSILDGFAVRAGGDINVGGVIAGARVAAKGSVNVTGGIVGHGKGTILAGRSITAKFIENARIEAREGVRVQKSILNSHVETLGLVEVLGKPGVVMGGLLRAGAGLHCRSIGSTAETPTRIHFGENFLVFHKLEAINKAVVFIRDRIREVEISLGPFETSGSGKLTIEERGLFMKLGEMKTKLLGDLRRLMISRVTVLAEAEQAPAGDVSAQDEINVGVILSTRGVDCPIETKHVHTRFRLAGDKIKVLPL